jgi:hypothetical protein
MADEENGEWRMLCPLRGLYGIVDNKAGSNSDIVN